MSSRCYILTIFKSETYYDKSPVKRRVMQFNVYQTQNVVREISFCEYYVSNLYCFLIIHFYKQQFVMCIVLWRFPVH